VAALVVALLGVTALASTGQANARCYIKPPTFYCDWWKGQTRTCRQLLKITSMWSSSYQHRRGIYWFKGAWYFQRLGSHACPPSPGADAVLVFGTWDEARGEAREKVSLRNRPGQKYTEWFSTISRCSVNPWVTQYPSCRLVSWPSFHLGLPQGFPWSARSISEWKRTFLRADFMKGLAPTIRVPTLGQSFPGGRVLFQAHVGIPPETPKRAFYVMAVEFKTLVWPGSPGAQTIRRLVKVPASNYVLFRLPLPRGNWAVRARLALPIPSGPWSSSINFKVP
jgi:hypothetical protein